MLGSVRHPNTSTSGCISSGNGLVKYERRRRNLLRYCARPNNRWMPALLVGLGLMALILLRSARGPSPVPSWPMNPTSVCLRLSFSMFSLSPRSLHLCRNEIRVVSWSVAAFSIVSMQEPAIWGILKLKVGRYEDLSFNFTCQNPFLTSNLVNSLAKCRRVAVVGKIRSQVESVFT